MTSASGVCVRTPEEVMEILEAYDLTGSYRAAAELAGCDHHTVARYVALRDEGRPVERMRAERLADPFLAKIEEWVERSGAGSARTWPTASWPGWAMRLGADHPPGGRSGEAGLAGREPSGLPAVDSRAGPVVAVGLGRRPLVAGRRTWLWCAWLAWSRFRVVCLPQTGRCRACWACWTPRCGAWVGCRPTR